MAGQEILLVREEHDDGALRWSIPSGGIEDEESFRVGAARELAEECGILVDPEDLVEVSRVTIRDPGGDLECVNFLAVVDRQSPKVGDPDEQIRDARWFVIDVARQRMAGVAFLPLVEPILHFLTTGMRSVWRYEDPARPGTFWAG